MTNEFSKKQPSVSDQEFVEKWKRLKDPTRFEHESIILFLEFNPDPRSVPHIRDAIKLKPNLKYLDYDDYGAYYKKCLWALQKFCTPDALHLIEECANSVIPELKQEALYRLKRIGKQL